MKKQLLTSAMAVAMLAPTAGAFAATSGVVSGSDQGSHTSNLDITGQVLNQDNLAPEGQLSVTLPTAASFTVDSDGTLVAPTSGLDITNKSACDIDVKVTSFTDNGTNSGITVYEDLTSLSTATRADVTLSLLPVSGGINGSQVVLASSGFKSQSLVTVPANGTAVLGLVGTAGQDELGAGQTDSVKDGAQDSFTLTFTVSKTVQP